MSKNTALGAEKSKERRITFKNKEHEKFYNTYLSKCRYQDTYHKACLLYTSHPGKDLDKMSRRNHGGKQDAAAKRGDRGPQRDDRRKDKRDERELRSGRDERGFRMGKSCLLYTSRCV